MDHDYGNQQGGGFGNEQGGDDAGGASNDGEAREGDADDGDNLDEMRQAFRPRILEKIKRV
jgi:hypothetical protein